MRRVALLAALAAALAAPAASAHPLGNFTVNRYAEVVLSGDRVYVRSVLDLAEIPTVQEGARVRARSFPAAHARSLELRLDGRRAVLEPLASRVRSRPGAGGLATLRFEAVYEARASGRMLSFRDRSFERRLGWREVVVRAERGADVERSSAPAESVSRALTAYPNDLLREPLDVASATVSFRPGTLPGRPPELGRVPGPERRGGGFEGLVSDGDPSAGIVLASLVLALFWGAAHALTPGHGKAIVAAYLVGARGTPRHAVLLGLVVTATHTIGVFAFGLLTLALSALVVPERIYPWLQLAAALLVLSVGLAVLRRRLQERRRSHHHHHHDHEARSLRSLVAVGVSGGLLPCPSALVVLLAAISLHRVGYGLVLILAFSVGLASVVTAVGLVAVTAKRAFARLRLDGPLVRSLPAVSAALILALGLAMTVRALPGLT